MDRLDDIVVDVVVDVVGKLPEFNKLLDFETIHISGKLRLCAFEIMQSIMQTRIIAE